MTITEPAATLRATWGRATAPAEVELPTTPYLEIETAVVTDRLHALATALPGIAIHYAVKANPHPDVLAAVVAAGANFDVASPAEVRACLAAGAAPDDLVYSNPVKRRDHIAESAALGVRVFVVALRIRGRRLAALRHARILPPSPVRRRRAYRRVGRYLFRENGALVTP